MDSILIIALGKLIGFGIGGGLAMFFIAVLVDDASRLYRRIGRIDAWIHRKLYPQKYTDGQRNKEE